MGFNSGFKGLMLFAIREVSPASYCYRGTALSASVSFFKLLHFCNTSNPAVLG